MITLGLLGICIIGTAHGASLLTAQKFPKTFNDLSFQQKIDVLSEGYEPFETKYDESGKCIANCPYEGITIEEDVARDDERTANALARAQELIKNANALLNSQNVATTGTDTTPPANQPQFTTSQYEYVAPTPQQSQTQQQPSQPRQTALFPANPLRDVPLIVTSPFGRRSVDGGSTNHKAIDLRAAIGTPVYATADGVVSRVAYQAENNGNFGCGKYIEIKHTNGYKTQYCHLSEQLVTAGQNVSAGQMIGKSGNTGGTNMAPHLHYMVYDMNGNPDPGAVNPVAYLLPGTWQCKSSVATHQNCSKFSYAQYQA